MNTCSNAQFQQISTPNKLKSQELPLLCGEFQQTSRPRLARMARPVFEVDSPSRSQRLARVVSSRFSRVTGDPEVMPGQKSRSGKLRILTAILDHLEKCPNLFQIANLKSE